MTVNPFLKNALILILLLFLFLFIARASAEPYVSKDFPLNEVIVKAIPPNTKILGKTSKDNEFDVFIQEEGRVLTYKLIRLDTNLWIFRVPAGLQTVLQK